MGKDFHSGDKKASKEKAKLLGESPEIPTPVKKQRTMSVPDNVPEEGFGGPSFGQTTFPLHPVYRAQQSGLGYNAPEQVTASGIGG